MSDDWDFYLCHVEDKPASIFVDLGIRADAPVAELLEMTWLRLYLLRPRDDGLPANEEFADLCEIEDALTAAIGSEELTIAYVGRNSSDGRRDFFFYSPSGIATEAHLSLALAPFPNYQYETGSKPDPQWQTYFDFLYPDKRCYQTISNERVLRALETHGDVHSIPREVQHWIYFRRSADRDSFADAALQMGYGISSKSDDGPEYGKFALIISRINAVDHVTINDSVLELFDLSTRFNGAYDGWETSVKK
jgi:hypothetical protein